LNQTNQPSPQVNDNIPFRILPVEHFQSALVT